MPLTRTHHTPLHAALRAAIASLVCLGCPDDPQVNVADSGDITSEADSFADLPPDGTSDGTDTLTNDGDADPLDPDQDGSTGDSDIPSDTDVDPTTYDHCDQDTGPLPGWARYDTLVATCDILEPTVQALIDGLTREEVLGRHCLDAFRCPNCLRTCTLYTRGFVGPASVDIFLADGSARTVVKVGTVGG